MPVWIGGLLIAANGNLLGLQVQERKMSNSSAPTGFPAGIPVSQVDYENWAMMIDVPAAWTCVPQNEDDVVRVCNWAVGAGFTVRPRGIMHGWSPLTVENGE